MSSHEQSGQQTEYSGLLGPAELLQYPSEEDGVQFAESYTTPGTEIDWEAHPDTATAAPETAEKRRAIITDDAYNNYYLRGNTLYDLSASIAAQRPVKIEPDTTTIEDLTIGEGATFSSQRKITSVVIATEIAESDQDKATQHSENPFDAWDKALGSLPGNGNRKKFAKPNTVDMQYLLDNATFPERDFHAALKYRHHPTRPGMVTNLHAGKDPENNPTLHDRLLEIDAMPGELSHEGHEMSPRSGVSTPTNFFSARKSYNFDPNITEIGQLGKERDPEKVQKILSEAVEEYIKREDNAAEAKAKKAREEKYVPTKQEIAVKEIKTAARGLLRRLRRKNS